MTDGDINSQPGSSGQDQPRRLVLLALAIIQLIRGDLGGKKSTSSVISGWEPVTILLALGSCRISATIQGN